MLADRPTRLTLALLCLAASHVVVAANLSEAQPGLLVLASLLFAFTLNMLFGVRQEAALAQAAAAQRIDVGTQCDTDETGRFIATQHEQLSELRGLLTSSSDPNAGAWEDSELLRHLAAVRGDAESARARVLATEKWRAARTLAPTPDSPASPEPGSATQAATPATPAPRSATPVAAASGWLWSSAPTPAPAPEPAAPPPPRVEVRSHDLHGHPCLIVRLDCRSSSSPLAELPDELCNVLDGHFENMRRIDGAAKLAIILDCYWLSPHRLPMVSAFELVKTLRAHYPQRAARVHVVNLPAIARWMVSAAISVVDGRTARKILVHDDAAAGLAKHFAPSQLLPEFGGTLSAEGGREFVGGWRADVWGTGEAARAEETETEDGEEDEEDEEGEGAAERRLSAWAASSKGGSAATSAAPHHRRTSSSPPPRPRSAAQRPIDADGAPPAAAGRPRSGSGSKPPMSAAQQRLMAKPPRPEGGGPRFVWTTMSEDEEAIVAEMRALVDADAELSTLPLNRYPDDELLRFLVDADVPYDLHNSIESMRVSMRERAMLPLPVDVGTFDAFRHFFRWDGVTKWGEPAFLLIINRQMQDVMLNDPEPFITTLLGQMEWARENIFVPGGAETIQTVVQVEGGFKLSLASIPLKATQRLMEGLTRIYPSYSSRILIINLPSYLRWFLQFVKGLLCEVTANKIEVVGDYDYLLTFYDEEALPSYFRERKSIKP